MTVPLLINSCRAALLAAFLALTVGHAAAQIPNTLLHSIPPPPTGVQRETGFSVAMDGAYAVVGFPFDKGFAYIYGPHPLGQDSDGLRDAWELSYWPSTTGHSALDDFDHDGYNELLELAFGLNPTTPNPGGLPPVTNENGYLTMTIIKQPGVTYEVQSAGTLQSGLPGSFNAASTTILLNDATLKVRDNFLIGTPPSRFLRVKVTAAP